jgi:hypothetical protein
MRSPFSFSTPRNDATQYAYRAKRHTRTSPGENENTSSLGVRLVKHYAPIQKRNLSGYRKLSRGCGPQQRGLLEFTPSAPRVCEGSGVPSTHWSQQNDT